MNAWTIGLMERGGRVSIATLESCRNAFVASGFTFLPADGFRHGPGMRLPAWHPNADAVVARAAAAALGIDNEALAAKANVSKRSVVRLLEEKPYGRDALVKVQNALRARQVEFLMNASEGTSGFRIPLASIRDNHLRY